MTKKLSSQLAVRMHRDGNPAGLLSKVRARPAAPIPILSKLCVGLIATGTIVGIQSCKGGFSGLFGSDDEVGVPLAQFAATDGNYFPAFVQKFFGEAGAYQRDYPTIDQARSDVRMIAVRPLNDAPAKSNEANLSWSADGVYLGFEVVQGGFRRIMLKDLVGDYARELKMIPKGTNNFLDGMVVSSAHSYNAGLRWSRDSTRFAFMSNGGIGEYNIYVGAVGSKEKTVARSPTKDGYATWSPSTNEIAFVSGRSGNGDIYLVELEDKKVHRLSSSKAVDIFPEWFPGAKRLVFSSGDAMNHNLNLVERDQKSGKWKKAFPLTKWDGDDLRPTVSPDGRYVAFYSSRRSAAAEASGGHQRHWDILVLPYRKNKTYIGRELEQMVVAQDVVIDLNTGPAWSPDSRKIFYVKRDPGVFNPIYGYDLFSGRSYMFKTGTRMNRDILMSKLGILSFRAQVGVWDRVYVALTNQGLQLQNQGQLDTKIHYLSQ